MKIRAGFTLVELIVVITILAILALVAFLMMSNATVSARDSNRLASIKNIYDASQLQAVQQRLLPLPDQAITLTVSGTNIGWQGYMSGYIAQSYGYSDSVYDPRDNTPYIYRVNQTRNKSQYLAYLENGGEVTQGDILLALGGFGGFAGFGIDTAQATDFSKRVPYVYGDRLGVVLSNTTNEGVNVVLGSGGTLDLGSGSIDSNYSVYVNEGLKLASVEGTGAVALKTNGGLDQVIANATIVGSSGSNSGSGSSSGSNDPTCGLTSQEVIDLNNRQGDSYTAEDWCGMTDLQWYAGGPSGRTPISDLPDAVAKLHKLESLDLGPNAFTTVPNEIQFLTNLKYLNLSENMISSIPEFIGNLTSLEDLIFVDNSLVNLPDSLTNLVNLTYLDFDNNPGLRGLNTYWSVGGSYPHYGSDMGTNITTGGNNMSIVSSALYPKIQISLVTLPIIHTAPIVTEKHIAAGADHTCGIKANGGIVCWGQSEYGGTTAPPGITNATHIDTGGWNGCVRTNDGNVSCWGSDGYDNEYNNLDEIEEIPTGYFSNVSSIDINWQHVCALNSNGSIKCYGQDVPTEITSRTDFVQVTTGAEHSCALDNKGWAVCWGRGNYSQSSDTPGFALDFISSGWYNSCGVRHDDQSVVCWGENNRPTSFYPWTVPSITGVTKVTVGDSHACAITGGNVACWGLNGYGQTNVPVGLSNVVDIDAGEYHTCALKNDNSVACWGMDSESRSIPPLTGLE